MDNINKIIKNALSDINLPIYYIQAGSEKKNFIVYNYIDNDFAFSNNKNEMKKYNVIINLCCEGSFLQYRDQIIEKLKNKGFIKRSSPVPYYDEKVKKYCSPLEFIYVKEE